MALSFPQLGLRPGIFSPGCVTESAERELEPECKRKTKRGKRKGTRERERESVMDLRTQSAGGDVGGSDDGASERGAGTRGTREGRQRQRGVTEASHGGHGTAPLPLPRRRRQRRRSNTRRLSLRVRLHPLNLNPSSGSTVVSRVPTSKLT